MRTTNTNLADRQDHPACLRSPRIHLCCIGALALAMLRLLTDVASAEMLETARVLNAAGGWSMNAKWINLSSVGEGVSGGEMDHPQWLGGSGFLRTYVDDPQADADADGMSDEDDRDDDNDGITDLAEITGSTFEPFAATDPMNADSDEDGAGDLQESIAGTNPLDAGSQCAITEITHADGLVSLKWTAREGVRYRVLRGESVEDLVEDPELIDSIVAQGGTGPWKSTTAGLTYHSNSETEHYRLQILPRL